MPSFRGGRALNNGARKQKSYPKVAVGLSKHGCDAIAYALRFRNNPSNFGKLWAILSNSGEGI
jgi:hypothetical protein